MVLLWKSVGKEAFFYWKSVGIALLLEWKEGEGKLKNDNIALVYQHKKTPTPQRLWESFYPKSVIRACLDFVLLEEWILFGF